MLAVLSVTGFMSGAFGQMGRATPLLFFEKKSKQKKLRLFVLREIFISSEKRFFHLCFIAKALKRKASKRNFGYRGALRLPCVKGAPPQAVRDCSFTTLQPLRGFRTRLGDAFIINLRLRRTASLRFSLLSLLSKKLPRLRGGIFHIIFV